MGIKESNVSIIRPNASGQAEKREKNSHKNGAQRELSTSLRVVENSYFYRPMSDGQPPFWLKFERDSKYALCEKSLETEDSTTEY